MQFLMHLKCTLIVKLFWTEITEEFFLVLLHSLSVTIKLCDIGVSLEMKTEMSPGIKH